MKNRLVLTVFAGVVATLLIGFLDPAPVRPSPSVARPAHAPSVMPTASGVEDKAPAFVRWVEQHGTEEQRAAVLGHVTRLDQAVPQDDHVNTYLATDHPTAVDARTRAIVDAYLAWAGPFDPTRMLVLYDASGAVMGAVRPDDRR
ncbi:hypothetical protein ACFVVL_08450 [Kitasatospora sp. NPDC058115]|uniref:hypothetical protein n=1 Tax=Kitasatospora sp. NPDC058115 TaxID=3346347 RepID=UPI0036DC25E8